MALHSQKKGKRGEVEFCKWLLENLNIAIERNYNQADGSSADVITDDFIFEVKRRENISMGSWWHQVAIAKKNHVNQDLIPVVAFRKNNQPWQFLIPAKLIPGLGLGYLIASERVFLDLARGLQAPQAPTLEDPGPTLEGSRPSIGKRRERGSEVV